MPHEEKHLLYSAPYRGSWMGKPAQRQDHQHYMMV